MKGMDIHQEEERTSGQGHTKRKSTIKKSNT